MLSVRVFADRFAVTRLGQVMECVLCQHFLGTDASYEVVAYAYEHLPADSMILKAMVYSHCRLFCVEREIGDGGKQSDRGKLPHDFLVAVMVRYMEIVKEGASKKLKLSDFHEHSCENDTSTCEIAFESWDDDIDEECM